MHAGDSQNIRGVGSLASRAARIAERAARVRTGTHRGVGAVRLASQAARDETLDSRHRHMGYYLIDDGRGKLIDAVGGTETDRHSRLRWIYRHDSSLYLAFIGF